MDKDSLKNIINLFDDIHRTTGEILNKYGHDPEVGSIAAIELSVSDGVEHIKSAYSQGSLLIEVAADQLSAFVRGITEPVLTIAPWTNARGVLETSAISVWLFDDQIDRAERIRRSYAFRCEGLEEQVKFARASCNQEDKIKAERGLNDVLKQAQSEGIEIKIDNIGTLRHLQYPIPSVTELVRDYLNEEPSYRLFSAMTHAHSWAVQKLGFRKVDGNNALFLETNLDIISVGYLALIGLKAFRKPVEGKCYLFGWPVDRIQFKFDDGINKLKLMFKDLVRVS